MKEKTLEYFESVKKSMRMHARIRADFIRKHASICRAEIQGPQRFFFRSRIS